MKLNRKYIKAFSEEKAEQLKQAGYKHLFEKNGVYFFEENYDITVKFSNSNLLNDTKSSMWINI
jgi:hypothetical protein